MGKRTQLDGAREILADAIRESVKRGKRLTQMEWETIIDRYDQVARIVYGGLGTHDDDMPMQAKYRLARTLDQMILDIDDKERQ